MSEPDADRSHGGLGSSVTRKEDRRLVTGHGRFVADIALPGLLHVHVVRSHSAHGRLVSVDVGSACTAPGVHTAIAGSDEPVRDLALVARSALGSYVETAQPILAAERVRFVGEAVAAIVAEDRYLAEDAAELVEVDIEPWPPVLDPNDDWLSGRRPPQPVHDAAPDSVLLSRRFEAGPVDAAFDDAPLVIGRRFTTNRHAAVPLEGRGAVASWDQGAGRLTLWSSTQVPFLVRHGLSEVLGLAESKIRVVAPDVGGGFGSKTPLSPEEVLVCALARALGRPVKWIEDRSENLVASMHAREHVYDLAGAFDADGHLRGLRGAIACDVGAYSVTPWTAGIEPLMAGGLLTGPYRCPALRCDVAGLASNKTPAGPYRGVARPASTFAFERLLDLAAAELGIDPVEIRRRNLIAATDIPYTAATRLVHDTATYAECFERAVETVAPLADAARRRCAGSPHRRVGVGFACYNELTGLGQKASAGPRMPFRTGHEATTVRVDPSGEVTVLPGVTSQGQGLETTMAQVVATALGVDYDRVDVRLGDTDQVVFGFGAFSSRQAVIGGGATHRAAEALAGKIRTIAAHLLEAEPEWLTIEHGVVFAKDAPVRQVTLAEVAGVAYHQPQRLPAGTEPGLEVTRFYDPVLGAFASGAQAAVVAVDEITGAVEVLDVVCVEDVGPPMHPKIVEGQVEGAVAQGIGGALLEHLVYDEDGNPRATTLADYLLPTSSDLPRVTVGHVVSRADNPLGVRGVGEGGTVGAPAAIANAVADALAHLGVEPNDLPLSPDRVRSLIDDASTSSEVRR